MSDKLSKARLEQLVKDATSATIGEAHNMARELLALREQAGEPQNYKETAWYKRLAWMAGNQKTPKAIAEDLIQCLTALNNTAPPAQPGAVCVPREPTEAMLIAARDWSYAKFGKPVGNDGAIGCYKAMLSAATSQTGRSRGG